MTDSHMAFTEKTFIKPSGPWRDARHVELFGSEAKGDLFPPRRVESGSPICVPVGLGSEALMVKYAGFKWNEERSTRIDVTLGSAMKREIGGRASERGSASIGSSMKREGP